MNEALKNKTLADFDKLADDSQKCELLDSYLEKSKKWLELPAVGRRGPTGRWIRNLKNYRPQHKDLIATSATPMIRVYLAYSNHKTMMPEIIDKWPVAQFTPDQDDDKQYADAIQARVEKFYSDTGFVDVAQKTVSRGMIMESALMELVLDMDPVTGLLSGQYRPIDIFSYLPMPGFRNTGLDLAGGDGTYVGLRVPIDAELVKIDYAMELGGAEPATDPNAKEYCTPGMLGMWEESGMGACVVSRFYWMSVKGGRRSIRGVYFTRLKEVAPGQANYKILRDFIVDSDAVICGILYPARLPIFRYVNDMDEFTGMGTGDPELVANNAQEMQRALNSGATVLKRNAIPTIFLDEEAATEGVRSYVEKIMAGIPIVRKNPGSVIIDQPPTFNQGTIPFTETLREVSNTNTGIHEVMAGDVKFSGMPFSAINALIETGRSRVRLRLHDEVARLVMENSKYIFKLLKLKEINLSAKLTLKGKDAAIPYSKEVLAKSGRMDVTIIVGGGLPKGRFATEARAMELLKAGLITPPRAIDDLAETNTEVIKQEYIEWNDLQQHISYLRAEAEAKKEINQLYLRTIRIFDNKSYQLMLQAFTPEQVMNGEVSADDILMEADLTEYKLLLDDIWEILHQFGNMMDDREFMMLPGLVQHDILMKFYNPPVPRQVAQVPVANQAAKQGVPVA